MDIQVNDIYRAILHQCKADIAETEPHARGRALVDFADFVMGDAAAGGASAIKELLKTVEIPPWDESWVVPELARAALDALSVWQSVADVLRERLNNSDRTETVRELCGRLAEARQLIATHVTGR